MKRWVCLMALAGCVDRDALVNRYYRESGYIVRGIHGIYEHLEADGRDVLTTGEGFQERIYTDFDLDGKPDEIRYRNEKIRRSGAGSEKLFEEADGAFDLARRRYDIAGIDREWREMSPDERARRQDYFK